MTVEGLINLLKDLPPDKEVITYASSAYFEVTIHKIILGPHKVIGCCGEEITVNENEILLDTW